MAALGALSGALDHRFALKLMRHGTWWAHPRLWLLLVGDPSSRKTPIINAATLPLEQHQTWLRENHQRELQDHVDSGGKPEQAPRAPARFVMWDTTTEKLGEILSHSERGLLVKRDEVTGWIGSMERYGTSGRGAGADRGFWLQAFDGGPFAQDRIGRGETYIKNLSVSLLGGIQPARLAELHGLTSDGLLQRFLPVMVRAPSVPQDMPGGEEAYAKLIKELILTPPKRLMLADDALVAMHQLHVYLHELEQASAGFAAGFQAFVGKLSGIAGSLALILHMVWNPGLGAVLPVEPITVEQVHDLLIDFLLPHSFAFYRNAETVTDGDRLQRLASWIITSGVTRFVASDLATNVRDFRGLGLREVNERVAPLVAADWLKPTALGPLCRAWQVNPNVATQFAQRCATEEHRKAAIASLMHSPRKPRQP